MGRVSTMWTSASPTATRAALYESVLTELGRTEPLIDSEYIDWGDFSIVADDQPVAKHLHVAFSAPSPELVRTDLRDPDGNSVEVVYTGEKRKPGAIDHVTLRTRDVAPIRRFYLALGYELGVDEPDHVQIGPVSYVAGEPPTEHVHRVRRRDERGGRRLPSRRDRGGLHGQRRAR